MAEVAFTVSRRDYLGAKLAEANKRYQEFAICMAYFKLTGTITPEGLLKIRETTATAANLVEEVRYELEKYDKLVQKMDKD
ncbi:unnamed protein product [Orchesella dallaii]|uniref:Four helix bundle protein n=1 Tax=Orchesella dallaii TaxID=48710 RepID=A0ABP1R2B7_9HEXA